MIVPVIATKMMKKITLTDTIMFIVAELNPPLAMEAVATSDWLGDKVGGSGSVLEGCIVGNVLGWEVGAVQGCLEGCEVGWVGTDDGWEEGAVGL